jgi:hypothetical protein
MANHLRRQIRERIMTDVTGLSTTGSNVFEGRVYPVEESKLPCLLVYDSEEEIDAVTLSPAGTRTMLAILTVTIEGYAQGGDGATVLDTLAGIQKEVQIAMAGDININSLAGDSVPISADISLSGEGSKPSGSNPSKIRLSATLPEAIRSEF